jgi:serine/threonine-protein kinase
MAQQDLQGQKFGPYTLYHKIASGGMAEIYLARTGGLQGFEKFLILKMIHPKWSQDAKFISMLIEEAKLAVTLNHTNIAQIFDLGKQNDLYYIAMEYVEGRDLFQILVRSSERDTYLPFDAAAFIAEQVASALHYAHSRCDAQGQSLRLIHRDVSPQNIIVSYNGEVKLIDFGIAKATMRPGETQVGVIKGKFYYMSPEQAWGRPLDHRTDIFSLGICLHEMLTGQMLYAEDNQMLLLEKVRAAEIPRPSQYRAGVPVELEEIVMKALAKDPSHRFQSGYEFQRALTEYLHRRSPGFTNNRVARTMWDLFPESTQAQLQAQNRMTNRDFAHQRPPDSVIFDLNQLGAAPKPTPKATVASPPVGQPSSSSQPAHSAGRREPTRSVAPAAAIKPPPVGGRPLDDERTTEDGFMFGDGFGAMLPPGRSPSAKQPAPQAPPASAPIPKAGPAESSPQDSTRIVDWDRFKGALPPAQPDVMEDTLNIKPGQIRTSGGRALPPEKDLQDESTTMYSADLFKQPSAAPAAGGLRKAAAPVKAEGEAGEKTAFFDPTKPPPAAPKPAPKAAPAPTPPPAMEDEFPSERTAFFDPTKPAPQPAKPAPQPAKAAPPPPKPAPQAEEPTREDEFPSERTAFFDPTKPAPPPPKPAPAKAAGPESVSKTDAVAKPGPAKAPEKPEAPKADAAPMSREEKIAAAKAKALAEKEGGAAAKPAKAEPAPKADAAPMSREEKIAAAKAKATEGPPPGLKKKGEEGADAGGAMSREEKIAAAKAKALAGGAADAPKPAAKKAKEEPADAGAAEGGEGDAKQAARAKAMEKAGKGAPAPAAPNKVSGASKGNAKSNMKTANRATILGMNAYTLIAGMLGMLLIFSCVGGYVAWRFFINPPEPEALTGVIEVTSTPPGASIEFNGDNLGPSAKTPFNISNVTTDGLHSVRVSLEGYVPAENRKVKVTPGGAVSVDFVLKPEPGELLVASEPPGADVLVKDDKTGEEKVRCTPTPCTINDLEHVEGAFLQVIVRKEGFEDYSADLKWEKEPNLKHQAKLVPTAKPEDGEEKDGEEKDGDK